jgi:hypothetical protein
MADSRQLSIKTVVEKNKGAAEQAKVDDPFAAKLSQGRQIQGQSPQVRLLAAYQTLRSALVSSTTTSPETFRHKLCAMIKKSGTRIKKSAQFQSSKSMIA